VATALPVIRFGPFQLDAEAAQLWKNGRIVRIKPQPFKVLHLLASRPGEIVTRDEIRLLLWGTDTFVDFEQGVNTVIRQVRDALGEEADRPVFLETVPKRGYRFIAPVDSGAIPVATRTPPPRTEMNLQKALWLNIAELRLAEVRRRRIRRRLLTALLVGSLLAWMGMYLLG
jgi:DNA-binding winged helix-turn-helix (wHTH) protein